MNQSSKFFVQYDSQLYRILNAWDEEVLDTKLQPKKLTASKAIFLLEECLLAGHISRVFQLIAYTINITYRGDFVWGKLSIQAVSFVLQ